MSKRNYCFNFNFDYELNERVLVPKNQKEYYYIYKIESTFKNKNGEKYYYIGQHTTKKFPDAYWGSGKKLNDCYKKYPMEKGNWKKIILEFADSFEEVLRLEKDFIGDLFNTDDNCLNLKEGGIGGRNSREIQDKINEQNRGRIPWNKGISSSEETKQKLRENHAGGPKKGYNHTEETKQKIREKRKLQVFTEETREKLRNKKNSKETREKISKALKGKKHTEETKRKIGKANSIALIGKKHSEETRKKQSDSHKGKKISKEAIEKRTETRKRNRELKQNEQTDIISNTNI